MKGDQVFVYRPTWFRRKSQAVASVGKPYKLANRINYVIYKIQQHNRAKILVHLHTLSSYLRNARDEQPRGGSWERNGVRIPWHAYASCRIETSRFYRELEQPRENFRSFYMCISPRKSLRATPRVSIRSWTESNCSVVQTCVDEGRQSVL